MTFNYAEWVDKHGMTVADPDAEACWGWVDLETTGLDPDRDVILEFGFIMTDAFGNVIEESDYHSLVFEKSDHYRERMDGMDDFVRNMHDNSALLADLMEEPVRSAHAVQNDVLKLLAEFDLGKRDIMWAGSSVHFDVSMMHHYMYDLNEFMHYRQANVSAVKVIAQKCAPDLYKSMKDSMTPFEAHRSMSDLGDSINEFKCYLQNFLWV